MDQSTEKRYYKIKEVAEMLELPASTLRFWESQFAQLNPRRNSGGIRLYTPGDVETLRMIRYLIKDKGLKIEAARDVMRRNRSGVSRHNRAVDTLKDIRGRLQSLLDALYKMR